MSQQTKDVIVRLVKEIGIEVAIIVGKRLINLKEELNAPKRIESTKPID